MSMTADELAGQYAAALRCYLAQKDEGALQQAYELGRETIAAGLGVMDLARAHENALLGLLETSPGGQTVFSLPRHGEDTAPYQGRLAGDQAPGAPASLCRLAGAFFLESLWPFEMMQRGFCEANRMLRDLNGVLECRDRQLAAANLELNDEIAERRRVERALRASEDNLRQLSGQILHAQEEERKRISRELHDEVGQALTAINMNLAMIKKLAASRPLAAKVADLQGLLEQTMETIHGFTRELRPAMLDHLGLIPALRAYVRNFGKRTGLRVRFSAAEEVEQLGIEEKTVLYRVTQEGLTNVAKHARAHRAAVIIRKIDGTIYMEVQDDGKALQVKEKAGLDGNKRLGLLGIQERVRLVNGSFSLKSEPGKGTTIRVQIPMKIGGAKPN